MLSGRISCCFFIAMRRKVEDLIKVHSKTVGYGSKKRPIVIFIRIVDYNFLIFSWCRKDIINKERVRDNLMAYQFSINIKLR